MNNSSNPNGFKQHDSVASEEILLLCLITFAVLILKTFCVLSYSHGATIFFDETLYKENAEAIFNLRKLSSAQFPLVYSLILLPAFLSDFWYEGMLVLNAIASSLLIPAVWFLARVIGFKSALLPAIFAAFLPYHAVHPYYILSENIFLPLVVVGIALTVRAQGKILESLVFGAVLSLAHLSKYLFLPAVPFLFLTYAFLTIKHKTKHQPKSSLFTRLTPALIAVIPYLALMSLWFLYGSYSGFNLSKLLGLNVSGLKTDQATLSSLLMWSVAYTCYVILAYLPTWALLLQYLLVRPIAFWNKDFNERQKALLFVTIVLTFGFNLICIQHSFGSVYNYPSPKYLIGRYLMHLDPLMLVLCLVLYNNTSKLFSSFPWKLTIVSSLCTSLLGYLSWQILFRQLIWDFPVWFANIVFNAIAVFSFSSPPSFFIYLAIASLLPCLALTPRIIRGSGLLALALTLLLFSYQGFERAGSLYDARHSRELAKSIQDVSLKTGETIEIFLDLPQLDCISTGYALRFWGIEKSKFVLSKLPQNGEVRDITGVKPSMLLSNNPSFKDSMKIVADYQVQGVNYFIYLQE